MPGTTGDYQPVTLQPSSGGDLITRVSPENVGGSNYVVKRDWRRVMDGEVRREGHLAFAPNPNADVTLQSTAPDGDSINLVHFSRKPNGQTALIIGTHTSLFRYYSFDDGHVFTIDVFTSDVFIDYSGQWLVIGDNFSESGNRWEAKDVAGKTVFSNGVDLPVIYDLGWLEVQPLYEFREQGFAFAGTIEEFNGMLVLGDVGEITEAALPTIMEGRAVSSVSQVGTALTATFATFLPGDVGQTITWGTGQQTEIISVSSPTVATAKDWQVVPLGPSKIAILYGAVSDTTTYSRVQYKLVLSNVGDPADFAGGASITANAGDTTISLPFPMFSLNAGDDITIPGAADSGAALETTILSFNGNHDQFLIADPIVTAIDGEFMQLTERLASLSEAITLQDTGSAIIRMMELQGRLVILKDDGFFVGLFTGTAGNVMQFQKVYGGPNCIGWKWMLAKMNGAYLLYAGQNGFYTFDLSSLAPQAHDKLFLCQDIFFNIATNKRLFNSFWCASNEVTNEVWFIFPNGTEDQGILFDHRYNTCSTISVPLLGGAATIYKPVAGDVQIGVGEDWFVFGTLQGRLFQYGLTDLTSGIWTRDGQTYDSTLVSGLIGYTTEFDESDLRNYVLYLGGFSGTPIQVTLYGGRNAHEPLSQLFQRTVAAPTYKTLIPTYFRQNYYQDQLDVVNSDQNARVVRRVLEFLPIDSRSTIRNNSD